jgi:cytochrome b6-f complex iron-sulfur subunit
MESETQEPQGEGAQGQPEPAATSAQQAPTPTVDTPVATPVPRRNVLTRRLFILGGFWSTLALAFVGLVGPSLDFSWPRKVVGAARKVRVSKETVQAAIENGEPVVIPEGRFFLVDLAPGTTPNGEETPGGLLALWQKCPHLGCTVPWRPDFTFRGRTGWFRCPCHGSTFTKEGGILVFGPSPRPMDRFEVEPQDDGSVVVTIGVKEAKDGSTDNPSKTVPYSA